MKPPFLCLAAALAVALVSTSADAQSSRVYRWTDAQGVTHYSDSPPADGGFQEVGVRTAQPIEQQAEAEAADSVNPECARARENLEKLSGDGEFQMLDEDGNPFPLTPAQVETQRRLAQAAIEAYCE